MRNKYFLITYIKRICDRIGCLQQFDGVTQGRENLVALEARSKGVKDLSMVKSVWWKI